METVKLLLTDKQTELLSGIFSKVADGNGMILGQFHEATEGAGFFEVGFVGGKDAVKLQEALGIPSGNLTPGSHEVYIDVD